MEIEALCIWKYLINYIIGGNSFIPGATYIQY